jgi:hypothetical protein
MMRKNKHSVGIAIGQRHIAAVMIRQSSPLEILHSKLVEAGTNLFRSEDYSSLGHCLNTVLKSVTSWIGSRYIPVRVALPDPAVLTHAMYFDTFPKQRMRQEQLITWQMEKTFHMQHDSVSVAYLKEREDRARTRVFITAIQNALLQEINSAFSTEYIEPESVMMAALFCSSNKKEGSIGITAHVLINPEYTSVVVLNADGMPYFTRSLWRISNNHAGKDEILDIIKDVKLALHAYLVCNKDKHFEKLSIEVENGVERDLIQQHFINQENLIFIDKSQIERSLYSSLESDHYCYNSALEAAKV